MLIRKSRGPSIDPCGTPCCIFNDSEENAIDFYSLHLAPEIRSQPTQNITSYYVSL